MAQSHRMLTYTLMVEADDVYADSYDDSWADSYACSEGGSQDHASKPPYDHLDLQVSDDDSHAEFRRWNHMLNPYA